MKILRAAFKLWLVGFVISAVVLIGLLSKINYYSSNEYYEKLCRKQYWIRPDNPVNPKESCLDQQAKKEHRALTKDYARLYLTRSYHWPLNQLKRAGNLYSLTVEGIAYLPADKIKALVERFAVAERDPANEWRDYALDPQISAALKAAYKEKQETERANAEMAEFEKAVKNRYNRR